MKQQDVRRKLFEDKPAEVKVAAPDMTQLATLLQGLMSTMAGSAGSPNGPVTGDGTGTAATSAASTAPAGVDGANVHNIASPAHTGIVRGPEGSGRGGADASRARLG